VFVTLTSSNEISFYTFQTMLHQQQRHKPKLEKVDSQQSGVGGMKKPFRKLNIDSIEDTGNNSSDSSSKSDDDDDEDEAHQYLKTHPNEASVGGEKHLLPPKMEINLKQFENLDASFPAELKEIMQYVPKYAPQDIDIDYKLQVFIPDFIPSVGDVDAFLKVMLPKPLKAIDTTPLSDTTTRLGLNVLDEPSGEQSEEALLQIKLRSIFAKPLAAPSALVKSPKDIDKWITEISSLHANRIHENFVQQQQTQINIDNLMCEWPGAVERKLEACYPSAHLDCTLSDYVRIICNLVDIPIDNVENHYDYIRALNVFFNLYIAVRNEK
jgi:intraflagellar transport protein 46